ncbi:MAG TPA: hypothetical protein VMT82_05880 [candidate division Zixibacteria bacterium]|nr:hypothetical protein [candidate division Zixibacteria bacterium]
MNWLTSLLLYSCQNRRVIDKRTHGVLDHLTAAYFYILAGLFWGRHPRASFVALTNATMVTGLALFTDYPGALRKVVPFETHGKLDLVQAATASMLPTLLGFASDAAALPFILQAGDEMVVVSVTDWTGENEQEREEELRYAS